MWKILIQSNKYKINISREIRNIRTNRITRPVPDKDGYLRVVLWYNDKTNNLIVHRLIAQHFIKNPIKLDLAKVDRELSIIIVS